MHDAWPALFDILVLLAAALVLGTIAEQLRQSAILGYLAAGTLVGPGVLGLVERQESVDLIAELGVALLLFTIGLEFSFERLRRLGRVAAVGGILQVIVTMAGGAAVAALFVDSLAAALAIGAIVSLSSTACVLRTLVDRAAVESVYGRGVLGILLLQDLAVIPLMLLFIVMAGGGTAAEAGLALLRSAGLASVLVAAFYLFFKLIAPRLLDIVHLARNRELPILLAVVLALGSALAAHELSLSPAMGAFMAGVLLGESPFAVQVRADVTSLRTLLVTLFFAAMGMLGEPQWAMQHWHLVAGTVAMVVVGKAAVVWAVARLLGFTHGLAAAMGLCLAQIGEFSFVLAGIARGDGGGGALIGQEAFRLVVSTTIATLFLTPLLVALAPRSADWIQARLTAVRRRTAGEPPATGTTAAAPEPQPGPPVPEILIIGFGPAGDSVAQALIGRHRAQIAVLELNPRNAAVARRYGLLVHVGDATHREVLEHAGVRQAAVVVLTVPDPRAARAIIESCKDMAPRAAIVVRARYHRRRWELQLAGAHDIVDEEYQVGMRLAAAVRRHLHGRPGERA